MKPWNGNNPRRVYTAAQLGLSAASNWTISDSKAVICGPMITLRIDLTYGGTTITAGATGNITDITIASGLAAAYLPSGFAAPLSIWTQGLASGYLSAGGNVVIAAIAPNGSIASGDRYVVSATWDLP